MGGWIKLQRQILNCWIWKEKPFSKGQAWIDLLLLANRTENKVPIDGKPTQIERGQFHTSTVILGSRWGWDRRKVSRFLDVLEVDCMIAQRRSRNGTTITIVNYDVYQGDGTTNGTTVGTTNGTANGTQTRNKEVKKERNNKYFDSESVNNSFLSFMEMRKKMKSPMTDRAIDLAVKKINELSKGDSATAVKIIDRSVMQGWKGFYPLDDSKKKNDFHDSYMKHNYDYDEMEKILLARD